MKGWAREGLADERIVQNIGIKRPTYDWKNKYSDITDTLKREKEVVDCQVENALFKRGAGYEYTEVTKELTENGIKITKKGYKTIELYWDLRFLMESMSLLNFWSEGIIENYFRKFCVANRKASKTRSSKVCCMCCS